MRYALLIYEEEQYLQTATPEELQAHVAGYGAVEEEMAERGIARGGTPLRPAATATTVRVREGGTLTTDGPFAETKEQLGGFFLIECRDLDEAIEIAAKLPAARVGSVEIRPVHEEIAAGMAL